MEIIVKGGANNAIMIVNLKKMMDCFYTENGKKIDQVVSNLRKHVKRELGAHSEFDYEKNVFTINGAHHIPDVAKIMQKPYGEIFKLLETSTPTLICQNRKNGCFKFNLPDSHYMDSEDVEYLNMCYLDAEREKYGNTF
jgi:hypothetical protein